MVVREDLQKYYFVKMGFKLLTWYKVNSYIMHLQDIGRTENDPLIMSEPHPPPDQWTLMKGIKGLSNKSSTSSILAVQGSVVQN